ncbi:MAG: hypothetical protein JJT81_02185 [Rubellimicrobium sp.]|nr:hypothetical protein [Rubellimicrobium sp.]
MSRRAVVLGLPATALAACSERAEISPPDQIVNAFYRHDGPPAITLFTVRNVETGNGAHSALMISGSQRLLFDPAGTFGHPRIARYNHTHFGVTPHIERLFISYHARETYYVVIQTLEVPPQTAEAALRIVATHGPVPQALCTRATAGVLRQLPGLGSINSTLFPDRLERQFARLPGVMTEEYRSDSADADPDQRLAALDAQLSQALTD